MRRFIFPLLFCLFPILMVAQSYHFPAEHEEHEATWLQWPHQYEYGIAYRNSLDATWVAMTKALLGGESVFIIAYNTAEQQRIINLLTNSGVDLSKVQFFIFPTNDVWVRDNGPIFCRDGSGDLHIQDWGFNGWGMKYNFNYCDQIPAKIANALQLPIVDLNTVMTNEGGAVEVDGAGVMMATRSSILSQSPPNSIRNPGMSQEEAESIFIDKLGVSKFIWLDGVAGNPNDVTDMHIDGFVKFVNDSSLVTMTEDDLTYWGVSGSDIEIIQTATNINGVPYKQVTLPLTQNDVLTTKGKNLGYKGSYVNYYVANEVVLVPFYNDLNDTVAMAILQPLYPDRLIIGIDCRNLYEWGGMVHCVTQQQPVAKPVTGFLDPKSSEAKIEIFPNPAMDQLTIRMPNDEWDQCQIKILNMAGKCVYQHVRGSFPSGTQTLTLDLPQLPSGTYQFILRADNRKLESKTFIVH